MWASHAGLSTLALSSSLHGDLGIVLSEAVEVTATLSLEGSYRLAYQLRSPRGRVAELWVDVDVPDH